MGIETEAQDFDKISYSHSPKKISLFYKYLLKYEMYEESVKPSMVKWAQDLQEPLPLDQWEKTWKTRLKHTVCVELKENYYKMQNQWYLTPAKIANIYKNSSPLCWRCEKAVGSFLHMWWNCEYAKKYWSQIHEQIQKIIGCQFKFEPKSYLLNMISDNRLEEKFGVLLFYMIVAARIVFASQWKGKSQVTWEDWWMKLMTYLELDKLTCLIRNRDWNNRKKCWMPLIKFVETDRTISNFQC